MKIGKQTKVLGENLPTVSTLNTHDLKWDQIGPNEVGKQWLNCLSYGMVNRILQQTMAI
jgi:hypothetical protein